MSVALKNTLVLVLCLLVVSGIGSAVTLYYQPRELDRLKKQEEVFRLQEAKVSKLLAEEAQTRQIAEEMVKRWEGRYKIIPDTVRTTQVIRRLNRLSRVGFDRFDLNFKGVQNRAAYREYVFSITGEAFFMNLYRMLHALENGAQLFKVRNLHLKETEIKEINPKTGIPRQLIMVNFRMDVSTYEGKLEGMSVEHPPVLPDSLFPPLKPQVNPFYPHILAQIPPNTDLKLDITRAQLVSIAGKQAVFLHEGRIEMLNEGDEVYLGKIVRVDPARGEVIARLNKGGIIEQVVVRLSEEPKMKDLEE